MKYPNWSEDEIKFLIKNYPKHGVVYCVEKLNRTKRAVELKKQKLKLSFIGIKERWKEDNVKKHVNKTKTYSDCLRSLGINNLGSSMNTLKKYIKKYNIDISHFLSKDELNKILIQNNKKDLSEILVKNSTYKSTTSLKNRLYKEGLKERKCEKCGQGEIWKGEKISLIIDHINGINNDNRIVNLRIVCPNCNDTLATHCRSAYN